MEITANQVHLKSWVNVPQNSDFPIQNLPFGIVSESATPQYKFVAVRIGDHVLNLAAMAEFGYFDALPFAKSDFQQAYLNSMMKHGKLAVRALRNRISELLEQNNTDFQNNATHHSALLSVAATENHLPVQIGDYTDFYSSKEHATNVGIMFRDPANALLPNWLWIP